MVMKHTQNHMLKEGKWIILFVVNILVQLIVLTTGGMYSSFFILYHLTAIAVGLFYSSQVAIIFLSFTAINIVFYIFSDTQLFSFVVNDPVTVILYCITFLAIIPLIHLLAERYHLKDTLFQYMSNQVKIEESIIADLHELVFVTDNQLRIISLNDQVERVLLRSRSELYHQFLFDVLYIKDENGVLFHKDSLPFASIIQKQETKRFDNLLFMPAASARRKVSMTIKSINELIDTGSQICIIITDQQFATANDKMQKKLEQVKVQHEARIDTIKKQLHEQSAFELAKQMVVIAKTEQDILYTQLIEISGITEQKVPIDIAKLAEETVQSEQEFAQILHVPVTCTLQNFTEQDIAPLITDIFTITPNQFTGPFFTALCDVKYTGLLLQKLTELAIILSSNHSQPGVRVTVDRPTAEDITIHIVAKCNELSSEDQADMFVQLYGRLTEKVNWRMSSGLEGYLAKMIWQYLSLNVDTKVSSEHCEFIIYIKKTSHQPLQKTKNNLSSLSYNRKNIGH
jgi:hypothetical protein